MNRTELQQLAEDRVQDAEALLNASQWSGAYYLAGYAIECGLKACIAKLTNEHDFPNKDLALKSYSHDIEELVKVAGLDLQRTVNSTANPNFGAHWQIAKDWDEKARYRQWNETDARQLFEAVTDATDGVLPWIKVHW